MRDLRAGFATDDGFVRAVDGVSFDVARGEVLAIVGESGSGKSVTAMAILGLQPTLEVAEGEILWKGTDLLTMTEEQRRAVRGKEIAMIFQDPLTALNPVHTVGRQIGEMARIHEGLSKKEAFERAVEMLDLVGIPEARKRASMYPHEFSGGMRQRAMIAMAITCKPDLLIADEPTTALDVTVQAQVLEVLLDIKDEIDSAIILITHDLGVVAGPGPPGDGHVRRAPGRDRHDRRDLLRDPAPLHAGPAGQPAAARRRGRRAAGADRGLAAVADPQADRVLVPPPLPLRPRAGQLRDRRPRPAAGGRRRPHGGLPLRRGAGRGHRRVTARDGRRRSRTPSWPTSTIAAQRSYVPAGRARRRDAVVGDVAVAEGAAHPGVTEPSRGARGTSEWSSTAAAARSPTDEVNP